MRCFTVSWLTQNSHLSFQLSTWYNGKKYIYKKHWKVSETTQFCLSISLILFFTYHVYIYSQYLHKCTFKLFSRTTSLLWNLLNIKHFLVTYTFYLFYLIKFITFTKILHKSFIKAVQITRAILKGKRCTSPSWRRLFD